MTRRWPAVLAFVACSLGGALPARVDAQAPRPVTVEVPGGEVTITADRLEQPEPNLVVATGNVELTRGTTRVRADRVDRNRDSGDAVAIGRVIFYDGEDRLTAERVDYNLKTGTGVVHRGRAHTAPFYRIGGETMERLDESHYLIRRGIFTTCEDDPPTWSFRFGRADADLENIVYGTNASVWVKSLPIIPWFPVLGTPVRKERQSGFLFPTFGSSSRKGTTVEVPFFWAINDSQDLTLTFDYYGARGVGLTAEYRYVLSPGASGSIRAFGIHETEVPENQQNVPGATTPGSVTTTGPPRGPENRGWWGIAHNWNIAPGLTFTADINGVSDDLVLREYSDSLYERSRPSVQSNVFLSKTWGGANIVGNLFWYQDLTSLRPIELHRLPDVRTSVYRQPVPQFLNVPSLQGLTYEVASRLTNFVREEGSQGVRFDLFPRLSLPIPVAGVTVSPFVAPRVTAFSKTATGTKVGADGVVVETTKDEPIARGSIDLGAEVEMRASRVYGLGGAGGIDAVLHSIEPRATYTWRNGSNLDPAVLPQWLGDNTPEASNLAVSVVNRLRARTVAPEGTEPFRWEYVRFTAGGSYDFKIADRPVGPLTGELIIDPSRYFRFRADTSYGVYKDQGFQTGNADLAFILPQFSAAIGTRFAKPNNSAQATIRADLTRYVTASFSTNWDLRADTFVENRFGVDIRFQCWALDFTSVMRAKEQGLTSADNEIRFALYLLGVGGPFGLNTRFSSVAPTAGATGR
jgi:LPS-assembly protein